MLRRNFLKSIGLILGGINFNLIKIGADQKLPKYWLWLRPNLKTTDQEWTNIFRKLREVGIEAVLPQIYSSYEALFKIDGYDVKEEWLERIIPIAHKENIQIHAWMWTMPCNDPKIISEHPEWYVVNRKGESAAEAPAYVPYYKFLCPRRPEVRNFIANRVKTLAAIPNLDGIHLDYVRMPDVILAEGLQPKYNIVQDKEYPEYDYCYCKYCREEYEKIMDVDPLEITDPASDGDWYQFRYNAVNELVNDFLVPEAKKGVKVITAAVFPNWESVRQQWHRWNLDAFLPMLYQGFYNAEVDWIGEQVLSARKRFEHEKPIYAGLFLPHLKDGDLENACNLSKQKGAEGFSLFAFNDLKESDYKVLKALTKK